MHFSGKIIVKNTDHNNSNQLCFIFKDSHYYEPIIYRVNMQGVTDIKILSDEIFTTFIKFNKERFINHLKTPYPRGRKEGIKSGIQEEKIKDIKCKDKSNYCKDWLKLKNI